MSLSQGSDAFKQAASSLRLRPPTEHGEEIQSFYETRRHFQSEFKVKGASATAVRRSRYWMRRLDQNEPGYYGAGNQDEYGRLR